ncbi:MAG TPA: serine/threonine-protein kinase [Polyangiales bacterium]
MSKENDIAGYPRQLAPHLELRRVLGEGGSSIVFEAFHTRLKVPVAVKLLSVRGSIAEQAKVRLLREAELYALLDDPRIPRVYDVDELPDGTPFVVMEFVPGRSLEALLGQGPLSARRAVTIAQEVLGALSYVHARGVLHRDVKPANVILHESEDKCQVRLVDFGIAKVFADAPESGGPLTQQGTLVGTPHYMAPERLLGEESDEKSDVYSVGVMLYEMLSGRTPFVGPTLGEIIAAVLRDTPAPLHLLCAHVSPALANIVHRAMERDPHVRYGSADAMLRALDQIASTLQGEISSPRIVPPVRSVPPPSLRTPGLLEVDDEYVQRRLLRRGTWQMPLALAAGLGLLAWSAWPSSVREPENRDAAFVASEAQPAAAPAQPEPVRDPQALRVNAPMAGEPLQQEPASPEMDLGVPVDPESNTANALSLEEGLGDPSLPAVQEPVAPASPNLAAAPAREAPAKAGKGTPRTRRADDEEDYEESGSGYEPVRSVPLQPLLDRLDTMLHDSLAPPTSPSALPAAEPAPAPKPSAPPRARTPESLPDNPY